MKLFSKRKTLKDAYAKREVSASEFFPYQGHWTKDSIITDKNELIKVIKLSGFAFETADDEDIDIKKLLMQSSKA